MQRLMNLEPTVASEQASATVIRSFNSYAAKQTVTLLDLVRNWEEVSS